MIEDVGKWAGESQKRIQKVFDDAKLGDHPLAVDLCMSSIILCRALLRDDLPSGFVVVSAYLGFRQNPLRASNPDRYDNILNEILVALAVDPQAFAYRCADFPIAVLFDLGGYAAVRMHGNALRLAVGESL
jgi:hypothetical protein